MKADIKPEWNDQDAFVIGGGSSLRVFEFDWLIGRRSLGVNDAFRAGPKRCERMIFADSGFWKTCKWDLEKYAKAGGTVYSVSLDTNRFNVQWVHQFKRGSVGMSKDPTNLGWNYNTGASALNLALLLGAKRVFLLGFDMAPIGRNTHWHNNRKMPTRQASFDRFLAAFAQVVKHLKLFPGKEVYNVGPGISKLEGFPKINFDEMKEMAA